MNLCQLSVAELGKMLRARASSAEEITRTALCRIAEHDALVRAFVHVDGNAALVAARQADAELKQGRDRGPMHGIPYALKDIYDVKGLPTKCQSRLRLGHVAAADSAVAARLREAGAILIGKAATFEFAIGGPSDDLPFPMTTNPWNSDRITGGSSSGSAAAIAAGYVRLAIGSCTAGSIRGPAAWCGAVGLKPTFGRISRHGVFPLSPSLDHCGPITRSVSDSAIALQVAAGYDDRDPDSIDVPVPHYGAKLDAGVKGLRLGVPRAFFESSPSLTNDARNAIEETLLALARSGAVIETVSLPDYSLFLACCRVVMTAEMYGLHRLSLANRLEDYGELTARRCLAGSAIDASDYINALRLKRWATGMVDQVLQRCDALVSAISLGTAPRVQATPEPLGWPLQASPFSVTGHPALSVPVGLAQDGMPLAIQLIGRRFDEATLLGIGRLVEIVSGWDTVPLPDIAGAKSDEAPDRDNLGA